MLAVQAAVSQRSGELGLSATQTSPGLLVQALVRLYCTPPQQLGYALPSLPAPFKLQNGITVTPTTRLVPTEGLVSLSAADYLLGKMNGEDVVLKTSCGIMHEVCPPPICHGLFIVENVYDRDLSIGRWRLAKRQPQHCQSGPICHNCLRRHRQAAKSGL